MYSQPTSYTKVPLRSVIDELTRCVISSNKPSLILEQKYGRKNSLFSVIYRDIYRTILDRGKLPGNEEKRTPSYEGMRRGDHFVTKLEPVLSFYNRCVTQHTEEGNTT